MFNRKQALGLDDQHVVDVALGDTASFKIHRDLVGPLGAMRQAAQKEGFDLAVASGYRSFDRQCAIWNAKANGERPVLDKNENPLDIDALDAADLLKAILHWSALPGGSRHHWGTDFDIYDAGALKKGQALALTIAETQTVFSAFYDWLNEYLTGQSAFVRPYLRAGAIACEPWHISYQPLAIRYERLLDEQAILAQLKCENVSLVNIIEDEFSAIYRDYIRAYFIEGSQ